MIGMQTWFGRGSLVLAGATLLACGGSGAGTETDGGGSSSGSGASTGQATNAATTTSGVSETSEPTSSHESHSGSDTSATVTASATDTASGTSTGEVTATGPGSSSTGGTDPNTTSDGTTGDGTTGGSTTTGDGTTTTGDGTTGSGSTTEPGCIPVTEVCNDVDDDCDGKIDNVDVGGDGICDCLNIALVGNQGANPSAEFQNWLIAQGTKVDRIHTNQVDVLDKATVNKYDIIILDYMVRSYTAEEAATLKTWVEAGGGLMSMTGFTNTQWNADRPNTLIKPMGLSYNTSKGWFSGPIKTFVPHPITAGLTSISFYGGLFIDIVEDGVGINKTIMTLPQGPVGVVQDRLSGRLFVFGDEWIEFDSEWKNIPEIKDFWVQTIAWIGPKNFCSVPQ
jgi:hypothetical protein